MSRGRIFFLLVVLFIIGSNFGRYALWSIAAVSTIALGVLIFAMRRQGDFRGPGVLFEDARERRIRERFRESAANPDHIYDTEDEK